MICIQARKLYHIVYDDGDEEDVYTPEIKRIVIFPKIQKRASEKSSDSNTTTKQKQADSNQIGNAPAKLKPSSAESKNSGINLKKEEKELSKPHSSANTKSKTDADVPKEPMDANEDKVIEEIKELFDSPRRKNDKKSASSEGINKKLARNKKTSDNERKTSKMSSKVGANTKSRGSADTGKTHQTVEKKRIRKTDDYGRSRTGAKRKKTRVGNDAPNICSLFCHICHETAAPLWSCPKVSSSTTFLKLLSFMLFCRINNISFAAAACAT